METTSKPASAPALSTANSSAQDNVLGMVSEVVAAYVSNNTVHVSELETLIKTVHTTLSNFVPEAGSTTKAPVLEAPPVNDKANKKKPAVTLAQSVMHDHVVCLEDGKKFRSLKRHLQAGHDLTPEKYLTRWGLPSDWPIVAPSYSVKRSALAKNMGLGRHRAKC